MARVSILSQMSVSVKWIFLYGLVGILSSGTAVEHNRTSNLFLDVLDENKLSAMFSVKLEGYKSDIGIYLNASRKGFNVETLNSLNLLAMQNFPGNKSQLLQILNVILLRYDETVYVVPQRLISEAQKITNTEGVHFLLKKLHTSSDRTQSPDQVFMEAFHQLTMKLESPLILQASEVLGNTGVSGSSHPYLLPLFLYATRLPYATAPQRVMQFQKSSRLDHCQKKPIGKECLGMCGRYCECWKFVCGDCCFHRGCYQHDNCCLGRKVYSPLCLFLIFNNFSCQRYGGYPKCIASQFINQKFDIPIYILVFIPIHNL